MKNTISRRKFNRGLLTSGALTLASSLPSTCHSAWDWFGLADEKSEPEIWLSAQGRKPDEYALGWVNPNNRKNDLALANFRGHGLAQNPAKPEHIIMFARRPGTQGIRLNLISGELDGHFTSATDRHMQGHGCFSADGNFIFCTESEISSGRGKVTVRDAQSFELINEFDSHGIGPHEIALMPDGLTLVIANGGLLTHPDSGRKILNLESMRSSLTYIDSRNGALISEYFVAEKKASIRHLDVADDGTVAIALQVQRKGMKHNELTPLAAIHKPGENIQMLHAPETLTTKLNDYMGSVAINNQHRIVAFTSPKGDLAMFWHLDDLSLQGYHAFHDVCGLTISQDNKYFVLSNSAGKIRQINAANLKLEREKSLGFAKASWDNHMISVLSSNS